MSKPYTEEQITEFTDYILEVSNNRYGIQVSDDRKTLWVITSTNDDYFHKLLEVTDIEHFYLFINHLRGNK